MKTHACIVVITIHGDDHVTQVNQSAWCMASKVNKQTVIQQEKFLQVLKLQSVLRKNKKLSVVTDNAWYPPAPCLTQKFVQKP